MPVPILADPPMPRCQLSIRQ